MAFRRYSYMVRMAERSKALRSGRSPLLWAWVRIPLLTATFSFFLHHALPRPLVRFEAPFPTRDSRVAQWKRAGPITQRSVDRNYALLVKFFFIVSVLKAKLSRAILDY